jgi:hypothetical protein
LRRFVETLVIKALGIAVGDIVAGRARRGPGAMRGGLTAGAPRLSAGLSSSASAGPIGCTSGRDALEFGALDLCVFAGFLGVPDIFAIAGIWGESGGEKRVKRGGGGALLTCFGCQ